MNDIKLVTPQVYANTDEGFIRLTTDEVRENLIDSLRRVLVEGERIVLQRAGEEVAAIIPIREFERLDDLMEGREIDRTFMRFSNDKRRAARNY